MTNAVLVTGVGGPAGVSVVNALVRAGVRTVTVDCDASVAGLSLGDASGVVPMARDPRFVEALCEIAVAEGADAIVPTAAEELLELDTGAEDLAGKGISVWVPSAKAVEQCSDKAAFAAVLTEAGVATPATGFGASDVSGPWIVKPRSGRGSRDVYACDAADEVGWALRRVPDAIVQTRLSGREFTVDALVDRDGRFAGGVPRWRLETRGGISTKGETFGDDRVTDSGGLQEEAAWFGVPVVVLRRSTARWEGVAAGSSELVGLDGDAALAAVARFGLLTELKRVDALECPYGDGFTSARAVDAIAEASAAGLLRFGEPDFVGRAVPGGEGRGVEVSWR